MLHAVVGLVGSVTLLTGGLHVVGHSIGDLALVASMYGVMFGWAPALVTAFTLRRGGALLLAALSGPLWFFCALSLASSSLRLD